MISLANISLIPLLALEKEITKDIEEDCYEFYLIKETEVKKDKYLELMYAFYYLCFQIGMKCSKKDSNIATTQNYFIKIV